ncbi:MAG: hypothetical protein H6622_15495 [Halobacteriovoraceae bacterium]|nr:hypothetical protein [Halobacteriovoraceae bacterium]
MYKLCFLFLLATQLFAAPDNFFPLTKVTVCQSLMMTTLLRNRGLTNKEVTNRALQDLKAFQRNILQGNQINPQTPPKRFDELQISSNDSSQVIQKVNEQIQGLLSGSNKIKDNEQLRTFAVTVRESEIHELFDQINNRMRVPHNDYINSYHQTLDIVFNIVFPLNLPIILLNPVNDPTYILFDLIYFTIIHQGLNGFSLPKDWLIHRDRFYHKALEQLQDKENEWMYISKKYIVSKQFVASALLTLNSDDLINDKFRGSVYFNNNKKRSSFLRNLIHEITQRKNFSEQFWKLLKEKQTVSFDILMNRANGLDELTFVFRVMEESKPKIVKKAKNFRKDKGFDFLPGGVPVR